MVGPIFRDQIVDLIGIWPLKAIWIKNSDRHTMLVAEHLHGGNIGIAITDENHSFKGYRAFVHWYPTIDGFIVRLV